MIDKTSAQIISNIYKKERSCLDVRDSFNKQMNDIIKTTRQELTELVSDYYWNTEYSLRKIGKYLEIPFDSLYLFAKEKEFSILCCICFKKITYIAKSRSQIRKHSTCSHKCNMKYYDIEEEKRGLI